MKINGHWKIEGLCEVKNIVVGFQKAELFPSRGSSFLNVMLEPRNPIDLSHTALHNFQKTHKHTKCVKPKSIHPSIDYQTTDEMGDLLIPAFLQHSYLTDPSPITLLRPWQHDLLESLEWEAGRNCVVVAPTSGGKTLIAEVAIGQLLEQDQRSQAIYALPFVALAAEKSEDFQRRFSQYSVKPFFQNIGGTDFRHGAIAICTYEKAHSILHAALKGHYEKRIKLVVIDEAHMIGDESRGAVCESLLMKLRAFPHPPRIIALTATLNEADAHHLANCIDGFCHFSAARSTPLSHYISMPNGTVFKFISGSLGVDHQLHSIPSDKDCLLPMVRSVWPKSVIIFVNTRNDTKRVALFLARNLDFPAAQQVKEQREKLIHELSKSPAGKDSSLEFCIAGGVAFHHAGLLLEERRVVEDGIRNGVLSVVVATTTLSAGINVRSVSRVIIHSPYRRSILINGGQFAQMAGRSGRSDTSGDVFTIARSEFEKSELLGLLQAPLPAISTQLSTPESVSTTLLQALTLNLATDFFTATTFIRSSFRTRDASETATLVRESVSVLNSQGMLEGYLPTRLGRATTSATLSVADGLTLSAAMSRVMRGLNLADDVHLVFLCTPADPGLPLPLFSDALWERIFAAHGQVVALITGWSTPEMQRFVILACAGRAAPSEVQRRELEKLFAACVLARIIEERPLAEIEREFKVDRGSVQALQVTATALAGQAVRFAEEMGFHVLAVALGTIVKRLSFAVKGELIDLMVMPSMRRDIARVLFDAGFKNPEDVRELSARELAAMLPHQEGGMTEDDFEEVARRVIEEADALVEQMALLERFEEESTWKKVMRIEDE